MDIICSNQNALTNSNNETWRMTRFSRCSDDVISSSVFCICVYIYVITALCLSCNRRRSEHVTTILLPKHLIRSFLSLIISIIWCFELGETFLFYNYKSRKIYRWNFIISICKSILGLLSILGYNICSRLLEKCRKRRLYYWFLASASMYLMICVLLVNNTWNNINLLNSKFYILPWLDVLSTIFYICLFYLDLYTALSEFSRRNIYYIDDNDQNESPFEHEPLNSYKYNRATFLSRASFWFLTSLLKDGYKAPLEFENLGTLPSEESSSKIYDKIKCIFDMENYADEKTTTIWKNYFKLIWKKFLFSGFLKFCGDVAAVIGPLGIAVIIDHIDGKNKNDFNKSNEEFITIKDFLKNGYVMTFIVLFAAVAQGLLSQASTHLVNLSGLRIKVAMQTLVYTKTLRLANNQNENENCDIQCGDEQVCESKFSKTTKCMTFLKESKMWKTTAKAKDSEEDHKVLSGDSDLHSTINLIQEDAANIMNFICIAHHIWAIPLKITLLVYLLYVQLGVSAILGALICVFTVTPLQFIIGKAMSKNSKSAFNKTDLRLKNVTEVVQNLKAIKINAWDDVFKTKLNKSRTEELKFLNKDSLFWALLTFLTHLCTVLIATVSFLLSSYLSKQDSNVKLKLNKSYVNATHSNEIEEFNNENSLGPAAVFSSLALFNQLAVPLFMFPAILPVAISAIVSTRRIAKYLSKTECKNLLPSVEENHQNKKFNTYIDNLSEYNKKVFDYASTFSNLKDESDAERQATSNDVVNTCEEQKGSISKINDMSFKNILLENQIEQESENKYALKLDSCKFSWDLSGNGISMQVNYLEILKGKLTLVVGNTGSGKTCFISSILSEMFLIEGSMKWASDTRVAYCSQRPFLMNASIQENITMFGQHLCQDTNCIKYKKVLKLCALDKELTDIQQSNLQTIGENGNTLSGGQKQRICLARAIYSDANVVVLDDPFSALDEQVSQQIFDSAIRNYLLKSKTTVVIATNKLKLLQYADQIIALENNKIRAVGTLKEMEVIDPILTKSWKDALSNEKSENMRTAKDRWRLCRMVTSASFHFNKKTNLISNMRQDFTPPRSTRSSIAYDPCLNFDLPLLWNELTDSTEGMLSRNSSLRSCYSHKPTVRAISLQSQRTRNSKIYRNNFGNLSNMEDICEKPSSKDDIRNKRHTIDSPHASNLLKQIITKSQNFKMDDRKNIAPRNIFRRIADRLSLRRSGRNFDCNRHKILSRMVSDASDISVNLNDLANCEAHQMSSLNEYNCNQRLAENQERVYGTIPLNIYLYYIKCCGLNICFLYMSLALLWQALRVYADLSLGNWSSDKIVEYESIETSDKKAFDLLATYCIQSAICAIVSLLCAFSGQWAGLVARKRMHEYLTDALLKDQNIYGDIGSTINRFSSDMSVIDKKLCSSIQRLVQFLLLCLCAILVNCIMSLWFLIITMFIGIIYYAVQKFYRRSSRELQRLESISRSPIFTLFSDTCRGAQTIRIYSKSKEFSKLMFFKLDENTNSHLLLDTSARWLGVALDCLGGFILFASALTALYFTDSENSSIAGFALNSTLLAPMYLNWVVRFITEVEISANAVHRVKNYCDETNDKIIYSQSSKNGDLQEDKIKEGTKAIDNERNLDVLQENDSCENENLVEFRKSRPTNDSKPGITSVKIVFDNVTLQHYQQSDPVIKNLHLVISSGEKLAVCGRTASGKSSLFLSLFGLIRITGGNVMLGDTNLSRLENEKFTEIRKKLCCVSQEGALFNGSFRHNLDPTNEYTDEQLWNCLELVKMRNFVEEFPEGLDNKVTIEGGALSHGQRQLLCLARVALKAKYKSTSPIILDECTSAVDPQTENIVLKDFWKTFHGRTIICIAHRLSIIMEFDRVIVLENGKIVENGRPEVLRHSQNGKFAAMLRNCEI